MLAAEPAPKPPAEAAKPAAADAKDKRKKRPLSELEQARIENMLLKEQIATMQVERAREARQAYLERLCIQAGISNERCTVDMRSSTLTEADPTPQPQPAKP